jgi:hypothetical protein
MVHAIRFSYFCIVQIVNKKKDNVSRIFSRANA